MELEISMSEKTASVENHGVKLRESKILNLFVSNRKRSFSFTVKLFKLWFNAL